MRSERLLILHGDQEFVDVTLWPPPESLPILVVVWGGRSLPYGGATLPEIVKMKEVPASGCVTHVCQLHPELTLMTTDDGGGLDRPSFVCDLHAS